MDETRKNGINLLPKDPIKRAKSRMIAEIINSGIQPYQNLSVLKRVSKLTSPEIKDEWVKFYISKGLNSLEAILKEISGKYCVGNELSIADLCLVPQIFHAKRNNVNFSAEIYPILDKINNELEKIEEFE